jgi:DNA-binding MarR family transcriptional regulator
VFGGAKGEHNCKAKLSEEQVKKIRAMYEAGGESTNTLARKFDVTQALISQIVLRKIWRHV